ncbi:DRTGG domain-containing protein [Desulfitibacter alkalitolerans]|uniref:DRTGG domain-containing protein n=1 Tax=Desulfitibacter alkalitolerans TaxID=264641 RepID=UPI000481E15F|nr:DRTGG domain-containing protein [Desulfitibacter alkalitolerans]
MDLKEVKKLLEAEVLWGSELLEKSVSCAFGCDLLSDVLAFTPPNVLLLTGLTNIQVINTAEMIEAAAVVFVRGKRPTGEVVDFARQKNIPLLATNYMLYDSCGILYLNGLKGCEGNG